MIKRLLLLNGFAVLGVILFHSSGMGFVAMFAWGGLHLPAGVSPADQVGSLPYYGLRLIEQIIVFSIPAFLFVSGYFAAVSAGRDATTVSWKIIFARIRTLLIPYLLWSAVVILLYMLTGSKYSPFSILTKLLTGGANEIYYFVPLLIQFFLLAPLLIRIARKYPVGLIIVCGLIQTGVQLLSYQPLFDMPPAFVSTAIRLLPKWLFLTKIFWFPLGMVAGLHATAFKRGIDRLRRWAIGAAIILVPLGMLEWEALYRRSGELWLPHRETMTDNLFSLAILVSILTWVRLPSRLAAPVESLGTKSFGIFLTHGIFIEYTAKVIYNFAPALLGYQLILQPVFIIAGLAGPLVIMSLVDRSQARKAYAYLYG